MTVQEVFNQVRENLDDQIAPYLWSDTELLRYYARALKDIHRKTGIMVDRSTTAVTSINLFDGKSVYDLHASVLEIASARVASETVPLKRYTSGYLDGSIPGWLSNTGTPRDIIVDWEPGKIRVHPYFDESKVITGTLTFDSAAGTITYATGGFGNVFANGDIALVDGTASNDQEVTITNVADTVLTVSTTLVDETIAGVSISKKMDSLELTVKRSQLTAVAVLALSVVVDLPAKYHDMVADGVVMYAYLKRDSETYDARESKKFGDLFTDSINDIKEDMITFNWNNQPNGPHYGSI